MKKYLTVNHAVLLGLLAFLISNIASVANLNKRITKVESFFSPEEFAVPDPSKSNRVEVVKP